MTDNVNHPKHYTTHPSGIECIDIKEMLPSNLADALKYLWRKGKKWDDKEDLQKALWYLNRHIESEFSPCVRLSEQQHNKMESMLEKLETTDKWLYHVVCEMVFGTDLDIAMLISKIQAEAVT